MAKTKSKGTTSLGRDSRPKYLGLKTSNGQYVKPGSVLIRQRGTKWIAGKNVARAKDNTLYALKEGVVSFRKKRIRRFDNAQRIVGVVSIRQVNC